MKLKIYFFTFLSTTVILIGCASLLSFLTVIKLVSAQHNPRTIESKLQPFVIPNKYSISYPSGWFVDYQPEVNDTLVMIFGGKPPDAIKTDVSIQQGSFETVVKQTLSSERVTKQGRATLGGREAFRIWISNDTSGEFNRDVIITLVRYNNIETVLIASFYDSINSSAIPIIEAIHGSFRVLE